jgi:hypothetical protein
MKNRRTSKRRTRPLQTSKVSWPRYCGSFAFPVLNSCKHAAINDKSTLGKSKHPATSLGMLIFSTGERHICATSLLLSTRNAEEPYKYHVLFLKRRKRTAIHGLATSSLPSHFHLEAGAPGVLWPLHPCRQMIPWTIFAFLLLDRRIIHMHIELDGRHIFVSQEFL